MIKKCITATVLVILLLTGCTKEVAQDTISDSEKEYYINLESHEITEEFIPKYIETYCKYEGLVIPDSQLAILVNDTDSLFRDELNQRFFNTMDKNDSIDYNALDTTEDEVFYSEGADFAEDTTETAIEADKITDLYKDITVIQIMYSYKDNKFIAKVADKSGDITLKVFQVKDGKVMNIYDL